MVNNYIQVPLDVNDDDQLRRFLLSLIAKLDSDRVIKVISPNKLTTVISGTYDPVQVQEISDKLNEIILSLKDSLILN